MNPEAEHLVIASNPRPRRQLPDEEVSRLWSDDPEVIELAIYRLMRIARIDDDLAADVRKVFDERLKVPGSLSFELGSLIQSFVGDDGDNGGGETRNKKIFVSITVVTAMVAISSLVVLLLPGWERDIEPGNRVQNERGEGEISFSVSAVSSPLLGRCLASGWAHVWAVAKRSHGRRPRA